MHLAGSYNLYATTLLLPWTNAPGNSLMLVFSCNQGVRAQQLSLTTESPLPLRRAHTVVCATRKRHPYLAPAPRAAAHGERATLPPTLPRKRCPPPTQRIMSLDPSNNLATLYATPAWPTPAFCSALSALGSGTLLMLDAANGFAAELVGVYGGARLVRTRLGVCAVLGRWVAC